MTIKILVADDSITMQKIVSLAFNDQDVEIESVSDGEAALDSAHIFEPDIVLADVIMPGYSGYEVCARIKEDPELEHIPVVLLVGTFEPFDELEASRVKCDGHIMKPFDTAELIQMVHSLVGDKTMTQNSEISFDNSGQAEQISSPTNPELNAMGPKGLVNSRVLESFLGSEKLLAQIQSNAAQGAKAASASKPGIQLSDDTLNFIVGKVIERMSTDAIKEVAWEVVPELSEVLIRRVIEEQNKS
jgi:CheY-like chemotaxis protein